MATTVGEEKFGGSTYIKEYFAAKDPASPAAINASSTIMAPTETKGSIYQYLDRKLSYLHLVRTYQKCLVIVI